MKRREKNYIWKVEQQLRRIERVANVLSNDDAEPVPLDLYTIMVDARSALRALGHDFPHPVPPVGREVA